MKKNGLSGDNIMDLPVNTKPINYLFWAKLFKILNFFEFKFCSSFKQQTILESI